MEKKKINIILLDLMDTIIPDPFFPAVKKLCGSMTDFSQWINPRAYLKFEMGMITVEEYGEIFFKNPECAKNAPFTFSQFQKQLLITPEPYPDVLEFIREYYKKIPLHLASNYSSWIHRHIEKLCLKKYFTGEFISYKIGTRKPTKKFFRYIINNTNLTAKEMLFIDDQKDNVRMAKELGFQIILAKDNWPDQAKMLLRTTDT